MTANGLLCCFHHLIADSSAPITAAVVDDQAQYEQFCQAGIQEFLKRIYSELVRESTEDGVLGVLRPIHEAKVKLPRVHPIPMAKPLTKWQRFAKEKGIQKTRRSGLVFDDVDQNWKLRHGGRSIKKAQEKRDFIIEHKPNTDYMKDPFEEAVQEKAAKRSRQKLQEIENKVASAGYKLDRPVKRQKVAARRQHKKRPFSSS